MPAVLLFGLMLGQAVTPDTVDDAALARIRKALEQPLAIDTRREVDKDNRPIFRLTVRGRTPDKAPWEDWTAVPAYIRPSYPLYHNEMLAMWTPEAFRASVLYPGALTTPFGGVGAAVPVTPIIEALVKQTKTELRTCRSSRPRHSPRHHLRLRDALEAAA